MSQIGDITNSLHMYQDDAQKFKTEQMVNSFNRSIDVLDQSSHALGKDEFLKILLTQLTHQDPTNPMEDKEFIAQMAQFSTLEQMTNMSESFAKLSNTVMKNSALTVLGRDVTIVEGDNVVMGKVEAISDDGGQLVKVNNRYYSYNSIKEIRE